MPVPKRKRSKSRRDKRFANKGINVKAFTECQNCQVAIMPHQACSACGFYKGVKVLSTKGDRAVKRGEAKLAKAAKAPQGPDSAKALTGKPEAPVSEPKPE